MDPAFHSSLAPCDAPCRVSRVAVVLSFALRVFAQQAVAQRVGLALQRGAVRRGRQCGNALVNGLRCVASELHMALFVVRQGAQVPVENRLLGGRATAQFGQLHFGAQPGGHLGDGAAARCLAPPAKGPAHVPAGVAVKALAVDGDGRGGVQRFPQGLAGQGAHGVGLLDIFFRDGGMGGARADQGHQHPGKVHQARPQHHRGSPVHSPQGSISVSSDSWSNSGANASMICCGSGQSVVSVITPNCTPPP